jgi:hypothetical protein
MLVPVNQRISLGAGHGVLPLAPLGRREEHLVGVLHTDRANDYFPCGIWGRRDVGYLQVQVERPDEQARRVRLLVPENDAPRHAAASALAFHAKVEVASGGEVRDVGELVANELGRDLHGT